jgi:hypothetical protein
VTPSRLRPERHAPDHLKQRPHVEHHQAPQPATPPERRSQRNEETDRQQHQGDPDRDIAIRQELAFPRQVPFHTRARIFRCRDPEQAGRENEQSHGKAQEATSVGELAERQDEQGPDVPA